MADRVVLAPSDPDWPLRFEVERAMLERALAPWLEGGIHHVGSTAIPGIAAKPVIDMIAGVRDLAEARAAADVLTPLGYVLDPHRQGIAHHFSKPGPQLDELTHGLHLTEPGSDLWRERIAFRDALRAEPELAASYEELKAALALEHPFDRDAYTAGKREFVASVLARYGIAPGRR